MMQTNSPTIFRRRQRAGIAGNAIAMNWQLDEV
jgi:hypothetical protein